MFQNGVNCVSPHSCTAPLSDMFFSFLDRLESYQKTWFIVYTSILPLQLWSMAALSCSKTRVCKIAKKKKNLAHAGLDTHAHYYATNIDTAKHQARASSVLS